MGKQRALYTLKWPEDHKKKSLAGLSVTMRGLSFNDLKKITKLQGVKTDDLDFELVEPVIELLSKRIVRWTLTDENDEPVPTDPESLGEEDFTVLMDIVNAWQGAVTGVSEELGKDSNSGSTFPEESIPMATL